VNQLLRLEHYTRKRPQEVLLVEATIAAAHDQIIIFKGFSSSLVNQTEFNPDIPLLPENAVIVRIDRLQSPYLPANPHYIQQGLTWDAMRSLLTEAGV